MNKRGSKRPLVENLSENNPPPEKRSRGLESDNFEEALTTPTRTTLNPGRRRRRRQRQRGNSDALQPRHLTKRRQLDISQDENDIGEITARLKRARLRPVVFTISSFIEQTVDDVEVRIGEEEEFENDDNEQTATFTFILPVAAPTTTTTGHESGRDGLCDCSWGAPNFNNEAEN